MWFAEIFAIISISSFVPDAAIREPSLLRTSLERVIPSSASKINTVFVCMLLDDELLSDIIKILPFRYKIISSIEYDFIIEKMGQIVNFIK